MIQSENSKSSAFPITKENGYKEYGFGLTKREYFAAMAMQGLLSNAEWMKEYKGEKYLMESKIISEIAIKQADNILKELNK